MALELFGFVFNIIGSFLGFWVNKAALFGKVTFGSFIIAAFVICFVIGKVLGIASKELSDTEGELYDGMKKEYQSGLYKPRHKGYSIRHNGKRL